MNSKREVMQSRHAFHISLLTPARWLAVFTCLACLGFTARAQEQILPPQPAPPPMKYIPDADRAQLSAARDNKARTRLSIELSEHHLTRAETFTSQQAFDAATAATGVYQALLSDAIKFLTDTGRNDGKTRDQFKRLEQALFKHAARIESMRRTTPPDYANNLRAAIRFAQDARATALDAFYGQTVLREGGNTSTNGGKPPDKQGTVRPPPED